MGYLGYLRAAFNNLVARGHAVTVKTANRLKRVFLGFVINLVGAAVLLSIIEDKNFGDSLWWAVVTATTTGYGDISPTSFVGRLIAGELMLSSVLFFLPLMIGHLYELFVRNKNQFSHDEQEWSMDTLNRLAERFGVETRPMPTDTEHGDLQ